MQKHLAKTAVELKEKNMLDDKEIRRLKNMFNPNDVDIVLACISNNLDLLKSYINKKYDLSVCNGKVLRYTVSQGYVDVSCLLLSNGIEP